MVTDIAWGRSAEIFNEDFVTVWEFDVDESVHCDTIMRVTNKMQLYRLIYYS
jgi:hypothetical protein